MLRIILLATISVIGVNIILPALPVIAEDFDSQYWVVSYTITAFAILSALFQFFGGPLIDIYGSKRIAISAISIFIVGSIGCTFSQNIYQLIFFRILQAPIILCFAISMADIKDTKLGSTSSSVGYISMSWAIGPMVAPLVGGALLQWFGWQSIFLCLAAIGFIVLVNVLYRTGLPSTDHVENEAKSYLGGYRDLFSSELFRLYTLLSALSIGNLYIFLNSAPLIADYYFDLDATQIGMLIGLVPGGFIIGSFIAGKVSTSIARFTLILLGRLATLVGLSLGLMFLFIYHLSTSYMVFFFSTMFIGIGNGISMAGAKSALLEISDDYAATSISLSSAIATISGVLMAVVSVFILEEIFTLLTIHIVLVLVTAVSLWVSISIFRKEKESKGTKEAGSKPVLHVPRTAEGENRRRG